MNNYHRIKQFTILFIILVLVAVSSFPQESYFTQDAYILTIDEGRIVETTPILDKELASIPLDVLTMSSTGDVIYHNKTLYYISDNRIAASEDLHPHRGNIVDMQMENSGDAIVYVVGDDYTDWELYVRRREKGEDRFSTPVFVRKHDFPPPYGLIHSLLSALEGRIIFWKESVIGTNEVFMSMDTTEIGSGEPAIFTELGIVQERKFLRRLGKKSDFGFLPKFNFISHGVACLYYFQ